MRRDKYQYRRFQLFKPSPILRFLRKEGRYWPSSVVAKHFGYSQKQINRLRFFYDLQVVHSRRAMKDPVYKRWHNDREKKRIDNLRKTFCERQQVRQNNLDKKLQEFLRDEKKSMSKICSVCKKELPKTKDFFRGKKRTTLSGKTYIGLSSVCLACPSKRRK